MCLFAGRQPPDGTVALDDDSCKSVKNSRGASSPPCQASQTLLPVRSGSFSPHNADRHDSGEARVARASFAVLASVVAGSLCGIALKQTTMAVAGKIRAIVIGVQILCWMVYTTAKWGLVIRKCASSVFQGYRPREVQPKSCQALMRQRILLTLTAAIPRRASF
ncbi:hypothetical protein CUR178_03195 [Leishmania enriettii]|uniref:Uncharacterized protein n=1 Tax=Leishmania enriettii TaxID=5663 RepID=A0A836HAD8_LEIEN|nr:hypothetical protein CUR178_03195 [Leishmania enriettii]